MGSGASLVGRWIRLLQGMQVEPHENLTVWSIRYDRFGPGRFRPTTPRHDRCADRPQVSRPDGDHADRARSCGTHHRPIERRVVEHTHQPHHAHCQPCHCDKSAQPQPEMFPFWLLFAPALRYVWPFTAAQPGSVTSLPPIPVQDFAHGQSVPPLGGLLDILA
jgi:hypothetical protein